VWGGRGGSKDGCLEILTHESHDDAAIRVVYADITVGVSHLCIEEIHHVQLQAAANTRDARPCPDLEKQRESGVVSGLGRKADRLRERPVRRSEREIKRCHILFFFSGRGHDMKTVQRDTDPHTYIHTYIEKRERERERERERRERERPVFTCCSLQ
jgi:hypothetical protein